MVTVTTGWLETEFVCIKSRSNAGTRPRAGRCAAAFGTA
jgi:hypothetical protein